MIHIGKVSASAMAQNAHAARNLPTTVAHNGIGRVSSSSMDPCRRSSAHSRIEIAGTRNRYSHGWNMKNGRRSACARTKKFPR